MWVNKYWAESDSPSYTVRQSRFIDRDFQIRYTLLVVGAVVLGMGITIIPIYNLVRENYDIFVKLSYDYAPQLLEHLERERHWISIILIASSIGLIGFFSWLALRMTSRIVGPLQVLRNHMRLLSSGNFSQDPIRIREKDEFQDLIEAYNYFYNSFKVNVHKDLKLLSQICIDSKDRDSYAAWRKLIEEKAFQVDALEYLPDLEPKIISSSSQEAS